MEMLYCIKCEEMEKVQNSPWGYILHDYVVRTEFGFPELDWCCFDLGWATCPPPEEYPDWDLDFEYVEEEVEMDYA